MSTITSTQAGRDSMETVDWVGVVLAVLLGVTYLFEAFEALPGVLGISFALAGLGYFGAIALVLADYRRPLVYVVGVGYNVLLIGVYFWVGGINDPELVGPHGAAKFLQVVFVVLLIASLPIDNGETDLNTTHE